MEGGEGEEDQGQPLHRAGAHLPQVASLITPQKRLGLSAADGSRPPLVSLGVPPRRRQGTSQLTPGGATQHVAGAVPADLLTSALVGGAGSSHPLAQDETEAGVSGSHPLPAGTGPGSSGPVGMAALAYEETHRLGRGNAVCNAHGAGKERAGGAGMAALGATGPLASSNALDQGRQRGIVLGCDSRQVQAEAERPALPVPVGGRGSGRPLVGGPACHGTRQPLLSRYAAHDGADGRNSSAGRRTAAGAAGCLPEQARRSSIPGD